MKISPHTHCESSLTGSPITSLIKRAVDLKREYFTYTDLGHLGSALKTYSLAKKANLKPVLGIEFYFKDSRCPFVTGTSADRCKYFTGTIYAQNQEAFQAICRVASKADMPKIMIREEQQSLWSWDDIAELSKLDTQFVLGGPHCMVGKALLASGPEVAEKVFLGLKGWFEQRLSLALVCEPWGSKFASVIKVTYRDGTYNSLLATDIVTTNKARKIRASDLLTRGGHTEMQSMVTNSVLFEVYKDIESVTEHKGFLPLPCDVTLKINQFFVEMAHKHGVKLLVSDYAFYADKSDKIVQTMVLGGADRLKSNLHMRSDEEFLKYLQLTLKLSLDESVTIMANTEEWAKNFDEFELKYEWRLADSGENPLKQCMDIIKAKGLMRWDDPVWRARLREEIEVIAMNGIKDLSSYFLPKHDVINYYEQNGRLTGPGRGSAAGCLLAYLMGITKVNPFLYDLSFNRFYSMDRIKALKLADIDSDLESRDLLVGEDGKSGYLYGRWGDKAAQISTRGKIRLKSAIKDVNRYVNGSVQKEIESITKALPNAPQGVTDEQFLFGMEDEDGNHIDGLIETSEVLKKYSEDRPNEWNIVKKTLGITRSFSKHACAFVIADRPIKDLVPIKDGCITQYEASACEEAGLVKYDFLIIDELKNLRICIELINKKNNEQNNVGYFTHKGKLTYIWDLPTDPDVYKSIWDGATESCFQINTTTMTPFVKEIMPKSMEDLSIILSLVRPGPLDYVIEATGRNMAKEYIHRRNGGSYEDMVVLKELLPETYAVMVYQEQVTKVAKALGFSGSEAENLREAIGKKKKAAILKIEPKFKESAVKSGKVTEKEADELWDRIVTFGRYAFNKSHGISYSYVTYACMFLKHHYNLEFWAATLTNATQNKITSKLWPHVKHLVAPPDINLSTDEMEIDYLNGKIRAKLGVIRGMGEKSIDPIVQGRPYKDIQDFADKGVAGPSLTRKLIHVGVLDSLFPPKISLLEKLQLFEDAAEIKKFNSKAHKPKKDGTLPVPKKGEIPEEYLTIENDPMKNAAIKKSILPSLLVGLYDLGQSYSKCLSGEVRPTKRMAMVDDNCDTKEVLLVNAEQFQWLNELPDDEVVKDRYVAVVAFIVSTEVFDYKKNTKQALKVVLDVDSYVNEHVMWPNYFTNQLNYPKELKKGQICTVFLKKRAGKDSKASPATIEQIVIEA